jgi:3-methyladenine DNA glycosylase AlkD
VLLVTQRALVPEANGDEALAMAAYMKHIAPFLGVRSSPRRLALRAAWRELALPTNNELGDACVLLMNQREREYHYAAYDLIETYLASTDETFLVEYVEDLLMTKPWWDTVDGLGSTAVSPLCWRYDATELVQRWSRSPHMWLSRAAIQHQRGWKGGTDIEFVLSICDAHSQSRDFLSRKPSGGRYAIWPALTPAPYALSFASTPSCLSSRFAKLDEVWARFFGAQRQCDGEETRIVTNPD